MNPNFLCCHKWLPMWAHTFLNTKTLKIEGYRSTRKSKIAEIESYIWAHGIASRKAFSNSSGRLGRDGRAGPGPTTGPSGNSFFPSGIPPVAVTSGPSSGDPIVSLVRNPTPQNHHTLKMDCTKPQFSRHGIVYTRICEPMASSALYLHLKISKFETASMRLPSNG